MNSKSLTLLIASLTIWACTPVSTSINNQYKLESYSQKKLRTHATAHSILVSPTQSVTGYQTEQMLYIQSPFMIKAFAKNAWISPPSDMIYPLIMMSLEQSGYFKAVASGPYADQSQFRLDTELLSLQQNFIQHPSQIELKLKAVLTDVKHNHVIASTILTQRVRCKADTPLAGVVAANIATQQLTQELTTFVINNINKSFVGSDGG